MKATFFAALAVCALGNMAFADDTVPFKIIGSAKPVVQQTIEIELSPELCASGDSLYDHGAPFCWVPVNKLSLPQGGKILGGVYQKGDAFLASVGDDGNGRESISVQSSQDKFRRLPFSKQLGNGNIKIRLLYQGPSLGRSGEAGVQLY